MAWINKKLRKLLSSTCNHGSGMYWQILFFLIVQLLLFILIFIQISDICWTHFFKQLRANFFLHSLIDLHISLNFLSWHK